MAIVGVVTVGASRLWAEQTARTGDGTSAPVLAALLAVLVAATRLYEVIGKRRNMALRERFATGPVPAVPRPDALSHLEFRVSDLESKLGGLRDQLNEMRGRLEARLDRAVIELDRGARSLSALQLDRAQQDAKMDARLERMESALADHIKANVTTTKAIGLGIASLTEHFESLEARLARR